MSDSEIKWIFSIYFDNVNWLSINLLRYPHGMCYSWNVKLMWRKLGFSRFQI